MDRSSYIQGYCLEINKLKQDRHIQGSPNYIKGRSILIVDPKILIDLYAGYGVPIINISGIWNGKERFTHTDIIGVWKSYDGKTSLSTNNGMIHYSLQKGVHIVPAHPNDHNM